MNNIKLNFLDQCISQFDQGLRSVLGATPKPDRDNPAKAIAETCYEKDERRKSAALMRINHTGEVCAQALYQGQAITARSKTVKHDLQKASDEENDHLHWCSERVSQLGSHTSYLNPVWYLGSLAIGITAGMVGDKWSLGFLAETERQVVKHLTSHLENLPETDLKSRAIVEQMRVDEEAHATKAVNHGAAELPVPIKTLMTFSSKIMTTTVYWV